jgi:hypothetical protein
MRVTPISIAILGSIALVACSDDGPSPGDGNDRTAALFEEIADSIAGGGDYARADALRHAAMVVRLAGEPAEVTLTIDGERRLFVAVAEELEYPSIVCRWPTDSGMVFPDGGGTPPDSGSMPPMPPPPGPGSCEPEGSMRMRTLIAWEPEQMAEVVRLVADQGRGRVAPGVPDAMAGPSHHGESWGGGMGRPTDPTMPPSPGDSAIASPPFEPGPGFMGEYLERDRGFWISVSGEQSNTMEKDGGTCSREVVEFDWARYACQAIRVRFEFAMRVQKLVMIPFDGWNPRDSVPLPPVETRDIGMAATSVPGARLSLLEWLAPPVPIGPPVPMPGPMPGPMPMPGGSGGASPGAPTGG